MIKGRVKAPSYGLMEDSTSVNGKLENNTESAPTSVRRVSRSRANGRMDAKSDGSAMQSATTTVKKRTDSE